MRKLKILFNFYVLNSEMLSIVSQKNPFNSHRHSFFGGDKTSFLVLHRQQPKVEYDSCRPPNKQITANPRYMRSFYLQIFVYVIQNHLSFIKSILKFRVIFDLFICKFVKCKTYFCPCLSNITRSSCFLYVIEN
jgi:hypothetical protein